MVRLFILWITVQLVTLWMVGIAIDQQITNETLECVKKWETKTANILMGGLFPLVIFIDWTSIDRYCSEQRKDSQ